MQGRHAGPTLSQASVVAASEAEGGGKRGELDSWLYHPSAATLELGGLAAVSQLSGSCTGSAAPSAAAASPAALLWQPVSASDVAAVAATKSSSAPAAVAMPLTLSACCEPAVLLESVLWALDLHHRRGVAVRLLVTKLQREVDDLQQLVTWQQGGGDDGPHAMPKTLVRRVQQLMELLHSSSGSASVTLGSWGSELPDDEPQGGVHEGDGGVAGALPVASPPPPQPLQRVSGRCHSVDACTISGCHICLYQLRRQRRAAEAHANNDGEPAPPFQRRQPED